MSAATRKAVSARQLHPARKNVMNKFHALHRFGAAGLGCVLLASAAPALAQDDNYLYGGGSIGRSRARLGEARITASLLGEGLTTTSFTADKKDTAYKLFGGYQFNRYFGLEAGYFNLGKFGFEATTTPAGTLNGDIRLSGFNLDLVGTLPLTQRLSAIGRVGVQNAKARDRFSGSGAVTVLDPNPSKRSTQAKVGAGLQYELTRSLLLRGEVERYRVNDAVGNKADVNMLSVGLVIPFGRAPLPVRVAAAPPYVAPAPEPVASPPPPPPPVVEPPPPPAPPPPPPRRRVSFEADALFGFDLSEIKPAGRQALDVFASELKGTRYELITVEGHTDRLGTPAYNQALSLRRADTVKNYLVGSGGIEAQKISAVGKGETQPVTKPEECQGKKANAKLIACLQRDRRVEVEVTGTR